MESDTTSLGLCLNPGLNGKGDSMMNEKANSSTGSLNPGLNGKGDSKKTPAPRTTPARLNPGLNGKGDSNADRGRYDSSLS